MLLYVVVYDITCDKRRQKVSDLLLGYGRRVQYSVFECVLNRHKYDELLQRLRQQVDLSEDKVRFYPITKHTLNQIETWGEPPVIPVPGSTII